MRNSGEASWWQKTRQLALATVAALALAALILPLASGPDILGLALDTFLGAIVLPFLTLVALFAFAARQHGLDRSHDVADE